MSDEHEYKGMTIKIEPDNESPESPRTWSNVGTILYSSSRYTLGDTTISEWEDEYELAYDDVPTSWQDWARFVMEHKGATVVLPVYAYIHGGVALRAGESMDAGNPFTCQWDSGQAGIIFDTPEGVAECGCPPERIAEALKGEVTVYDQWLQGDIYGYIIEAPDSSSWCGDSCWGFYGDDAALDAAKVEVDAHVEYMAREDAKVARACAL